MWVAWATMASFGLGLIGYLVHSSHRLEAKIDGLQVSMKNDSREVRSEIGQVRDELKQDIRDVKTELADVRMTVRHLDDRVFTLATRRSAVRPRPSHR